MPIIFRFFGYLFFFYSREHEPVHVHIEGKGGNAKYVYDKREQKFVLEYSRNIKLSDIKRIAKVIDENCGIIVEAWNNYFNERKLW